MQARETHLAERIDLAGEFLERGQQRGPIIADRQHVTTGRESAASAFGDSTRKRGTTHAQVVGEHRTGEAETPAQFLLIQRRENPAGALSTSGNSTCATMTEARPFAINRRYGSRSRPFAASARRSTAAPLWRIGDHARRGPEMLCSRSHAALRMPCMHATASLETASASRW